MIPFNGQPVRKIKYQEDGSDYDLNAVKDISGNYLWTKSVDVTTSLNSNDSMIIERTNTLEPSKEYICRKATVSLKSGTDDIYFWIKKGDESALVTSSSMPIDSFLKALGCTLAAGAVYQLQRPIRLSSSSIWCMGAAWYNDSSSSNYYIFKPYTSPSNGAIVRTLNLTKNDVALTTVSNESSRAVAIKKKNFSIKLLTQSGIATDADGHISYTYSGNASIFIGRYCNDKCLTSANTSIVSYDNTSGILKIKGFQSYPTTTGIKILSGSIYYTTSYDQINPRSISKYDANLHYGDEIEITAATLLGLSNSSYYNIITPVGEPYTIQEKLVIREGYAIPVINNVETGPEFVIVTVSNNNNIAVTCHVQMLDTPPTVYDAISSNVNANSSCEVELSTPSSLDSNAQIRVRFEINEEAITDWVEYALN